MNHTVGNVTFAPSLPFVEPFEKADVPSPETVTRKVPRLTQRKRAQKKVSQEFYDRYERVLMLASGPFIAAEITKLYEDRYGKLSVDEAKGLGGFFGELQLRGVIEKTGAWRARKNGNASLEYRLK